MRILTSILGARPQFIKYAPLSSIIQKSKFFTENIIHTGQHYDKNMSSVFFDQLKLSKPKINLNINSVSRGEMIGKMIEKIDLEFQKNKPDIVIVFGDTNSTLAGAIAASSFNCEIIHIEAGLRSFNRLMPEEHNRVLTDHLSSLLFVPSNESKLNLLNEGISENKIYNVGDIMLDTFNAQKSNILKNESYKKLKIKKNNYILATIHRQDSTNNLQNLKSIFDSLNEISLKYLPVILPLHPRTRKKLEFHNINIDSIKIVDPYPYIEFMSLVANSNFVITDSGGLQKEAYYLGKKTIVLRTESEWRELADLNESYVINPINKKEILNSIEFVINSKTKNKKIYGNGTSAKKIVKILLEKYG